MSNDIYTVRICANCADMALGMILSRVSSSAETARCQFCGKKKVTDLYRVTAKTNNRRVKYD